MEALTQERPTQWRWLWGSLMSGLLLTGCAVTYERLTIEPDGTRTVTAIEQQRSWWANLDEPDWMAVRRVRQWRAGQLVHEEACTHEQPTLLICTRVR